MLNFLFLSLSCFSLLANGQFSFSFNNYTKFISGNVNIILSAPHEGPLRPDDIPDRTYDKLGNIVSDGRTSLIAEMTRDELTKLFAANGLPNVRPFLIMNNLHRYKKKAILSFSDSRQYFKEN